MESVFKIEKNLKAKNYTIDDLCRYLNSQSISVVYMTLKEIANKKINNIEIINEIKEIADNKKITSSMGLGVSTMRIAAIATLKDLGIVDYFNILDEYEKNLVMGAFL